jgi:hypothetical protein
VQRIRNPRVVLAPNLAKSEYRKFAFFALAARTKALQKSVTSRQNSSETIRPLLKIKNVSNRGSLKIQPGLPAHRRAFSFASKKSLTKPYA